MYQLCLQLIAKQNDIIMAQQHQSMTENQPAPTNNHPPSTAKLPTNPIIQNSSQTPVVSICHRSTQIIREILPEFKKRAGRHHEILGRMSSATFSADKLIRFLNNLLKIIRNFKLIQDLRPVEKIAVELGQLRRLLRVDRLCIVARDSLRCLKKERLSKMDYFMTIFRGVLLAEDCSDALAYLIQLKVIQRQDLLGRLRKNVADLYFLECIGWILYYSYEYLCCESEEHRLKSRLVVVRYLLDLIVSHNDFSRRRGELGTKTISVLGVLSSLLNIYIAWK